MTSLEEMSLHFFIEELYHWDCKLSPFFDIIPKSILDEKEYEKGIIVNNKEIKKVNLYPHKFNGEWNYTIKPLSI